MRSAAVRILLVTRVTVRRNLTSRSHAAVLFFVVTPVTDCRQELIQLYNICIINESRVHDWNQTVSQISFCREKVM